MRLSSLLPGVAAVLVGAAAILPACGSTVATSGTGGVMASTGDGAPGTGGAFTTGPGTGGGTTDGGGPPDAPLPIDGGGPPDAVEPLDAGPTCPGAGDVCTNCLAAKCSATYCSCYGNVDCGQILKCFQACAPGDMACDQACETAHPNGISAAVLLSDCAATQCPQGCPGNTKLSACQQCLYAKCDVQMNTCVANAACVAYFNCIQPCGGGATCVAQCQAAHPTGLVDASKVSTCAAVSCPGAGLCG